MLVPASDSKGFVNLGRVRKEAFFRGGGWGVQKVWNMSRAVVRFVLESGGNPIRCERFSGRNEERNTK